MAEIRDTLRLDIDQALRQVRELENALNRALGKIAINLDTRQAVRAADRLNDELSEGQKFVNKSQDAMRRFTSDLKRADNAAEKLDKEMRDVAKSADKAADQTRRIGREAKKATGQFKDLGKAAKRGLSPKELGLTALAGFGIREVVRGLGSLVSAASDTAESVNAVNVVFGEASDTILAFGRDTSDAVFLASEEFNSLATITGNLLQGFNLDAQTAADLTIQLTNRAADLASVFNTEVGEALEAINSALRGETEQIRRFTGSFSIEEVKRFGREMFNVTGELTDQQKALAAVELIMSKTAAVQGDAANTAGEYANQQRKLNELWGNAQAALGEGLIPVAEEFLGILIDLAPAAEEAGPQISGMVEGGLRTVRILGNLTSGVINLGQGLADLPRSLGGLDLAFRGQFIQSGRAFGNVLDEITLSTENAAIATERLEFFSEQNFGAPRHETINQWALLREEQERTAAVADQFAGGVRDSLIAAADAEDTFREASRNAAFEMAKLPVDDLVEKLESTDTAFRDAADAADAFRTATLELADPIFAAAQAQERLTSATEALAELRKDPKATDQALALARLAEFEALLEADAAKLAIGDFERFIDLFVVGLDATREEVREILTDIGIFTETEFGLEIVATLDTTDVDAKLAEIPSSIDILAAFRIPSIPTARFPDRAPDRLGDTGASGGVTLNINNPVDSDIAGGAAQAANIVSTIPGILNRVR